MKILILDDDDVRHEWFARELGNNELVHIHTFDEFVETLNKDSFDVIFLDHDLNDHGYKSVEIFGMPYSRPTELTGLDAAEHMTNLPSSKRPDKVIVHSWNPGGARLMMDTLKKAGFNAIRWEFDPSQKIKV